MMKHQPADHLGQATTFAHGRRVFSGTSRGEAPAKVETLIGDRQVRATEEGFGESSVHSIESQGESPRRRFGMCDRRENMMKRREI
jgi:hypothetical protein